MTNSLLTAPPTMQQPNQNIPYWNTPLNPKTRTQVRNPHNKIVGINDATGWGSTQAATMLNAGMNWARLEIGGAESPATALSEGFKVLAVVANSDDGTLITTLNDTTQANLAVSQFQSAPQITICEYMNEPWLKGGQEWPVKYGRMYMAAVNAFAAAGIPNKLLFCSTGDYSQQAVTTTGNTHLGSGVIDNIPTTENYLVGMALSVNGSAAGLIQSIDSATQVTMDTNASSSVVGATLVSTSRFGSDNDHQGWLGQALRNVPGLGAAILANGLTYHPYGGPFEFKGDRTGGIGALPWLLDRATEMLGATPKCYVTEFGYLLDDHVPAGDPLGFDANSQGDQAQKLDQAMYEMIIVEPRVTGIFLYQSHDGGWGIMESDGSTRESFDVYSAWAKASTTVFVRNITLTAGVTESAAVTNKRTLLRTLSTTETMVPTLLRPRARLQSLATTETTSASVAKLAGRGVPLTATPVILTPTIQKAETHTFSVTETSTAKLTKTQARTLTTTPITTVASVRRSATRTLNATVTETASAVVGHAQTKTMTTTPVVETASVRRPFVLTTKVVETSWVQFPRKRAPAVIQTYRIRPPLTTATLTGATTVLSQNGYMVDIKAMFAAMGENVSTCSNLLKQAFDDSDIMERVQ